VRVIRKTGSSHSNSSTFSDGRASTAFCPLTIIGRCISTGCCKSKSITAAWVTYLFASRPSVSKFLSLRTRSAGGFGNNENRRSKVARSSGAFRYSITSNSTPRSRRISSAPRDCPQPGLWYTVNRSMIVSLAKDVGSVSWKALACQSYDESLRSC